MMGTVVIAVCDNGMLFAKKRIDVTVKSVNIFCSIKIFCDTCLIGYDDCEISLFLQACDCFVRIGQKLEIFRAVKILTLQVIP